MPTTALFTPIVGEYDSPFVFQSGDGTDVPRNPASSAAGDPRPGVLRHLFILEIGNPLANSDDAYSLTVDSPFTPEQIANPDNATNSFVPHISVSPLTPDAVAQELIVGFLGATAEIAALEMSVVAPAGPGADLKWQILVDFFHTAVS